MRQTDAAIVAEVQVVRSVAIAAVRRRRPIVGAVVTDTVETAIGVVARTRSRVPDGGSTTELAGEVHAFICAIVQ